MIDVVIPTIGRPSLARLMASLAQTAGPRPSHVFIVDDRRAPDAPLDVSCDDADLTARIRVLVSGGRGPAAARNRGWRASRARWIAFLDDDVVVAPDWLARLARDLHDLPPEIAGSIGRVHVPLPGDRKPTDWERNVAALERSTWITADAAYRRSALLVTGGFDERFTRAFREDADLGLRVVAQGLRIVAGERRVLHPVGPARWDVSVRLQAGNADDPFMAALHGAAWRARCNAPPGAFRSHAVTVAAAAIGLSGAAIWAALTARFAWRRIAPGPRSRDEIATMLLTSALIPFAAVFHRLRGIATLRARLADRARAPKPTAAAVLFDRDGTLVHDVPDNRDPARVAAVEGAREALARLREAGIATAVITNQAAIAAGRVQPHDLARVHAELESQIGPLGPVFVCAHAPDAACSCRKPAPGMVQAAALALDVRANDCVVIGDIGADVDAARAAGARAILVPTGVTRADECLAAPRTARTLGDAVDAVLRGLA